MATASTPPLREVEREHSLNVGRMLVSGGVTAAIVFVLCWLGTFITFSSPTHAYIGLFTNADVSSGQALAEGTLWSLLFGALVSTAFAIVFNATAALTRR